MLSLLLVPIKTKGVDKKILIWILPMTFSFLIYSCTIISCNLNKEDKTWLIEEKDSIYYLRNQTDTVAVDVNTSFGKGEYEWLYGLPNGDNDEYGYSEIKIPISDTIHFFRYLIKSCSAIIRIESYSKYDNKTVDVFRYYANKDSLTDFKFISSEKEYENCFHFSNPEDTVIREFIFVKGYGIVKFLSNENDLYELLSND